jgi:F-type H+-transporting ATPase subunit b
MPQLHFHTFPSQLFWLAVTFVALYWVMAKVALPRIERIIEDRRNRLDEDLEKAAQMKSEAEAVIHAYQKALADARLSAQAVVKETIDRLAADAAERQRAANTEIAKRTAEAEARIAAAKNQALGEVRTIAVDVARAAAARLTGAEVPESEVRAAVDAAVAGGRA